MNTVIAVDLIKGRPGPWPRIESETHIVSTGSVGPLEDSVRTAQSDLVHWLTEDFGLELMDAYQLVTPAVLAPLAHVCDTNYTSVANFPKRFPPGAGHGRHRCPPAQFEGGVPEDAFLRLGPGPSRDPACGAALAPRPRGPRLPPTGSELPPSTGFRPCPGQPSGCLGDPPATWPEPPGSVAVHPGRGWQFGPLSDPEGLYPVGGPPALGPRCHSGVRVRSPDGVILAEGTRKFDSAPLRR
jgi:hypothetical protein